MQAMDAAAQATPGDPSSSSAAAAGQATPGDPSSSAAAAAVPKRRYPTPDHPPYSWMIQEAIVALAEHGGSSESSISGFIRGRHPGVPVAHDRFLPYYLAKHVAEGIFVRTATGRYACCPGDDSGPDNAFAVAEVPARAANQPKRPRGRPRKVGLPLVVKRGPGRPRKEDSQAAAAATASAGPRKAKAKRGPGRPKKDDSLATVAAAACAGPPTTEAKRGRGRPPKDGLPEKPASGKKKKLGSGSPSAMPKRRGRSRLLTDVTDKKEGSEAPSTTDKNHGDPRELALMVVNNGSGAASVTEDDGGEAPAAKRPLLAKEPAASTTPKCRTLPCKRSAGKNSSPEQVTDKEDDTGAPLPEHKRRRSCRSAPPNSTSGSAPTPIADKEAGRNAASAPPKGQGCLTLTAAAGDVTLNEDGPAQVKARRRPRKQFVLNFYDEVPDNPMYCVLALPAPVPEETKPK